MKETAIQRAVRIAGGQAALAEKIGVTQGFVGQMTSGYRPVPARKCLAICAATNGEVTPEELLPEVFVNPNGNEGHQDAVARGKKLHKARIGRQGKLREDERI